MELVAAPLSRKQSVTEFTLTPRRLRGQTPFPRVRRNIMRTMNRSTPQPSLTRLFRAVGAVVLVAVSLFAGQMAQAAEPGLRLTPEQRRDMWQRMTPEQRQQWRNARSPEERQRALQQLSPEQRRDMAQQLSPEQREMIRQRMTPEQRQNLRGQMTPDEREAMRKRFHERQQGLPPSSVPPPPRQLSPEERQRLREQIDQARRDVYRRGDGGNKGPNK